MTEPCLPRIVPAPDTDDQPSHLLRRLDELARSSTVAVVAAPAASGHHRDELAAVIGNHVVIVLAAAGEREAIARAQQLTGGDRGAGVAVAPFDGTDGSAVLESARVACDRAAPGAVLCAREATTRLELGTRVAIMGDDSTARAYDLARRLARFGIPVTICGPTGSGKDLIAAALHHLSARASRPFVALNCAAIPEGLAEAELFGHAKGAFTGAAAARAGLLEASSGGTLFLDEIGELSPAMQARLLRVIENGIVHRVGETSGRPIELHVIAATHRDLAEEVAAGRFRKDLWYRLGVARIDLAPLCDRPRDLAALVRYFLHEASARAGHAIALAPATARALFAHRWPGNVRELRHAVDFAIAAAAVEGDGELLLEHLPAALAAPPRRRVRILGMQSIADEVAALERTRMIEGLMVCGGNQSKAAALIRMPLRSFVTKLKRYAIAERDWNGD